jgi:hypothetical protein
LVCCLFRLLFVSWLMSSCNITTITNHIFF